VWIENRIYVEFLQLVIATESYDLIVLHPSQSTIGHTRSSQSVILCISRCSVAASNGGYFTFS
jgi:hypothetical protein